MKKVLFVAAGMVALVGCKKVSTGGNQGVLRQEDGVERYSDVEQESAAHSATTQTTTTTQTTRKTAVVEVKGTQLTAYENGLESRMVAFLNGGGYEKAANDQALASTWYDFDNVNFEMGSSNKLLGDSHKQLENLATILKAYPTAKIKIGGYTDKTGDETGNMKLSQSRAQYIQKALADLGVGAQIVSAEGYGSKFAKVPATATDAERATDRKMAVRFTK